MWFGGTLIAAPFRVATLGWEIVYPIFSFFIVLALITSTLNDALPSWHAFLTGTITDQHLQVRNTCLD